ncbi:hypothetical protein TNCV_1605971 [Trichonephila clavipes]|nr:hypothetical protein TNCV_1605971 [Trichonephila clavipes]
MLNLPQDSIMFYPMKHQTKTLLPQRNSVSRPFRFYENAIKQAIGEGKTTVVAVWSLHGLCGQVCFSLSWVVRCEGLSPRHSLPSPLVY